MANEPKLKAINLQLDRHPSVKAINFVIDKSPVIKGFNLQMDLVDSVNIRGPVSIKSNTVFM